MKRLGKRTLFVVGILVGLLTAARLTLALWPYPELDKFLARPVSTRILDRNGALLQVLPLEQGLRREAISLKDLPPFVPRIILASEDRRFYWHPGVDPGALARALWVNNQEKRTVSGASTLTMQLARMVRPRGQGWGGKIGEIVDALRLEARLNKDRILELYLNNVTFSFQVEGIASASRAFFGKPVSFLNPEEASVLAVIPRRPALYSPLEHPAEASRAAWILASGSGLGNDVFVDLSPTPFIRAAAGAKTDFGPVEAPHFVQMFFANGKAAASIGGRSEVRTSLDLGLQKNLESILELTVAPWKDSRLTQGSGIVLDNATGGILAYCGSLNFFDTANQGQIDGVRNPNQPGSTLKPFLYAMALEKGFLPNTILPDIPTDFGTDEVYVPMNFNGRFNGPVRLRVALASSLNVPAVSVLQRLGVRNFGDFLLKAGFNSLAGQMDTLGVGLAIGNAEVSLLELTRAFALFPRGGSPLVLRPLNGGMPPQGSPSEYLVSPTTAGLVVDMLSDSPSRFLGFGHGRVMDTPYTAMFKTGTSNQYQNVWALGATPDFTVGIWMGNFKGQTIIGRTGSGIPAKAVVQVLDRIAKPESVFAPPPNCRRITIDPLSGGLATSETPSTVEEWVPLSAVVPPDTWHIREGGQVVTRYPAEYSGWLRASSRTGLRLGSTAPEEFAILKPSDGATFFIDPTIPSASQTVAIETTAGKNSGIRVWVEGSDQGPLADDGTFWLPLQKGTFTVVFRKVNDELGQVNLTVR